MARLFRCGNPIIGYRYAQLEVGEYLACITVDGDLEHCHITDRRTVSTAYKCIQVLNKEYPSSCPWKLVL